MRTASLQRACRAEACARVGGGMLQGFAAHGACGREYRGHGWDSAPQRAQPSPSMSPCPHPAPWGQICWEPPSCGRGGTSHHTLSCSGARISQVPAFSGSVGCQTRGAEEAFPHLLFINGTHMAESLRAALPPAYPYGPEDSSTPCVWRYWMA